MKVRFLSSSSFNILNRAHIQNIYRKICYNFLEKGVILSGASDCCALLIIHNLMQCEVSCGIFPLFYIVDQIIPCPFVFGLQ